MPCANYRDRQRPDEVCTLERPDTPILQFRPDSAADGALVPMTGRVQTWLVVRCNDQVKASTVSVNHDELVEHAAGHPAVLVLVFGSRIAQLVEIT